MFLAGPSGSNGLDVGSRLIPGALGILVLVALVAGIVMAVRGNRPAASLLLGLGSLGGLFFPPLIVAGVTAIVLGISALRRLGLPAGVLGAVGIVLGVAGTVESLVFPAIIASVFVYAAFHGGQLPG